MAIYLLTRPGVNATGRPSRRELLGAAGFTALAGIAAVSIAKPDAQAVEVVPVAHDPDGPLMALCARFLELQANIDAIDGEEGPDHQDQLDGLIDAQVPTLDEIDDLDAVSLEGMRQRARVVMAWYDGSRGLEATHLECYRIYPLFRDLLGEDAF